MAARSRQPPASRAHPLLAHLENALGVLLLGTIGSWSAFGLLGLQMRLAIKITWWHFCSGVTPKYLLDSQWGLEEAEDFEARKKKCVWAGEIAQR